MQSKRQVLIVHTDSKLDSKSHLHLLPELADLNNCNNTLYFEARRHEDLYMWAAKTPNGPSIKLHVQNVHTMDELKMTGNCLKGSRGILSFDKAFDDCEWGRLTKEVFTHVSPDAREDEMPYPYTTRFRYSVSLRQRGRQSRSLITYSLSRYSTTRYGSATTRFVFGVISFILCFLKPYCNFRLSKKTHYNLTAPHKRA